MKSEKAYIEFGEGSLTFATRTLFVPGRKVRIGFSVRKKAALPLVEETVLKLIRATGGLSLSLLLEFFDFGEDQMRGVIQPLVAKGFIVTKGGDLHLSASGESLFGVGDGSPAIAESVTLDRQFWVDDFCGLPVNYSDISHYLSMGGGGLKWIIEDVIVPKEEKLDVRTRVIRSFSQYFQYFIRNESDSEKIRSEQMVLHKTEYCKTMAESVIPVEVQERFLEVGTVETDVVPFDGLVPKNEERRSLRERVVNTGNFETAPDSVDEVAFIRRFFGEDFLKDCFTQNQMSWHQVFRPFFEGHWPVLSSGARLVVGSAYLPRNVELAAALLTQAIREREISKDKPLVVAWLRPLEGAWGRSLQLLDAIRRLRETATGAAKGAVRIEIWENRREIDNFEGSELRSYLNWFDDARVFRSDLIPSRLEILMIGDVGGLVITHRYKPVEARSPCPIGVYFEGAHGLWKFLESQIEGRLRSLPRPAKNRSR